MFRLLSSVLAKLQSIRQPCSTGTYCERISLRLELGSLHRPDGRRGTLLGWHRSIKQPRNFLANAGRILGKGSWPREYGDALSEVGALSASLSSRRLQE